MSPPIVARAGALGLTAEQVSVVAVRLGLPETTPVLEVCAEVNGTPIAPAHANREAKRVRAAASMSQDEITVELRAAVADGRIPGSGTPRWRGKLTASGSAARAELRALTPVPQLLAAAAPAPSTATPAAPVEPPSLIAARPFSLTANVDEAAAAAKAAPPATPAADTGVTGDPVSGAMSWNGLPVSTGPDGTPLVHTTSGAMTVEAFQAAGLDAETERAAVGLAHLTGTAQASGLPPRNPLFGGS